MCLGLVGCSGSKTAKPVSQETPQIELSDADEFIENPSEQPAATEEITAEEPVVAEASDISEMNTPVSEMNTPVIDNTTGGSEQTYKVQKNETLMMIAFKLYGDYGKWKSLANYNRETLKGSTVVTNGMTLKYMAPAEEFVWNPQGLPYLIRTGDTLGTVSKTVYETPKNGSLSGIITVL